MDWCKRIPDKLGQLEVFLQAAEEVEKSKELILDTIITKTPKLEVFMRRHSVFDIECENDWDWLVKFMYERLIAVRRVEKEDGKIKEIPEDIMDLFSKFKPVLVDEDDDTYPVIIEYCYDGDPRCGESRHPVNVRDTAWENLVIRKKDREEVKDFIEQYGVIPVN